MNKKKIKELIFESENRLIKDFLFPMAENIDKLYRKLLILYFFTIAGFVIIGIVVGLI